MNHLTDDPNHPDLTHGSDETPVPQAEVYLVLSEAERAKGFVRPVRCSYVHIGRQPKYPLRDLTEAEKKEYFDYGYVKYEAYPKSESPVIGSFWTQEDLDRRGCGTVTKMGYALGETYARDPTFYGSTYCCHCQMHRPVIEFVWEGTNETVGS
jgi:hypothetical protein